MRLPYSRVEESRRGLRRGRSRRPASASESHLRPSGEEDGRAMFERFTERARRVIILAQEEAKRLNHSAVGTEHILFGIIREGEGVASKVLESLNISPDRVRAEIESAIGRGGGP